MTISPAVNFALVASWPLTYDDLILTARIGRLVQSRSKNAKNRQIEIENRNKKIAKTFEQEIAKIKIVMSR